MLGQTTITSYTMRFHSAKVVQGERRALARNDEIRTALKMFLHALGLPRTKRCRLVPNLISTSTLQPLPSSSTLQSKATFQEKLSLSLSKLRTSSTGGLDLNRLESRLTTILTIQPSTNNRQFRQKKHRSSFGEFKTPKSIQWFRKTYEIL